MTQHLNTDAIELFPTDRNGHVWQFAIDPNPDGQTMCFRHCQRCARTERLEADTEDGWCVFEGVVGDDYCAELAGGAK